MADRLTDLLNLLDETEPELFILFALALEYRNKGENEKSLDYFLRLLAIDPFYLGAYYQLAGLYVDLGLIKEADKYYNLGIELAISKSDTHTLAKLKNAYIQFKETFES